MNLLYLFIKFISAFEIKYSLVLKFYERLNVSILVFIGNIIAGAIGGVIVNYYNNMPKLKIEGIRNVEGYNLSSSSADSQVLFTEPQMLYRISLIFRYRFPKYILCYLTKTRAQYGPRISHPC